VVVAAEDVVDEGDVEVQFAGVRVGTWSEIYTTVTRQKSVLLGLPSSITASLQRTADGVAQAIKWHSVAL